MQHSIPVDTSQLRFFTVHVINRSVMRLLIFAHRGEAKAFLGADTYSAEKSAPIADLYQSESNFLLITGEGIEPAMLKTAMTLTYLHSIDSLPNEIINLGICGSIDPRDKELVGKVLEIRTIYANRDKTEFKSFTCHSDSKQDLITTSKRILEAEQTEKLLPIAKLVDREAWGVFYAIQQTFKVQFKCIKMVSDNVHHENEFCQRIKETAEQYSIALYQYFSENFQTSYEETTGLDKDHPLPKELSSFYFTYAQKNLFLSLCEKLNIKPHEVLQHYNLTDVIESKTTPKEKTKVLIQKMQESLSPMLFKLREELSQKSKSFSDDKIHFSFDPNLEKEEVKANLQFKDDAELEHVITKLKSFPLHEFQKVYRGDF